MDQESRDANSLLVELDRGLQSPHIGEQSEAVVRSTNLFQRFPLPILINSACLKLAEAFRCGSNFIRVQICEVLERNQSQLNKIYNVDEFYRNLFTVTTSNDPIARAITLLTLGHIAPIVSSFKGIHHYISSSLESPVECELDASIACAACYVKQSSEFACNIYPKIVSIIDSDKSSIDRKIRALSVLDHGFYNANDAMTVRCFLIEVIAKSEKHKTHKKLTCSCLTLSTKIAYTSLSHIVPQTDLLLNTFQNDPRRVIKLNALKNLGFLAEKSPHVWETSHVEPLICYIRNELSNEKSQQDHQCMSSVLSIFCKLLTCKCNFVSNQEKSKIFQLSLQLATSNSNVPLCLMAFELLTIMTEEHLHLISKNTMEYKRDDMVSDTFGAIKLFFNNSPSMAKSSKSKTREAQQINSGIHSSKTIYRHIVRSCQLNPHYCPELLELVFTKISNKDTDLKKLSPFITEFICAIVQSMPDIVITPENCWKLIKTRSSHMSETNLLNLCVIYFQTLRTASRFDVEEGLVERVTQDRSMWFGFKVMRQALRYGHYKIAGLICRQLHELVTTDTMDFYFKSLQRICDAEFTLLQESDLDTNLKFTLPLYEDAVSPLRASIGHSRTTNFQLQYLWLRIRTLQAHSTLRQCCKIYKASPISYATLLNAIGATRGPCDPSVAKLGIVQQMPKIAKDFRYLAECYENLSAVSFDCDNRTLDYIHLLKCSCLIMADAIDAIFQYGKNLPVISKLSLGHDGEPALEHRELAATCNKLIESIKSEILKPGIFPSTKPIEPQIMLLRSFSDEILRCPFVYTRYFFQPLQITQIKLAITPQPSSSSGSISLILNYNLVLRVEGLIKNLSKSGRVIRRISKVMISVSVCPSKVMVADPNSNFQVQSVATPHNSYFKTEFLLPLRLAGSFNAEIDVSIIDEQERIWKTGPTEKLSIVVS